MVIEVGSSGNPNFIEVRHGKMLISVPKSVFKGRSSVLVEKEAAAFRKVLGSRYPWLSSHAIDVIMEESRDTMESILEMERSEVEKARAALEAGRTAQALRTIESRLAEDPGDADAWCLRGEIMFRLGEREEGFRSFAKARGHRPRPGREAHPRKGR